MKTGYKNPNLRKDNFEDVIPTFKRNSQADQGEIFVSRETEKVSFKKGINEIVNLEGLPSYTPNTLLPTYADHTAAAAAITVLLGAVAGNTYLYHNQATNSIGAVRL